eukprot:351648-Chlamydomonas_euryale.AAC.2
MAWPTPFSTCSWSRLLGRVWPPKCDRITDGLTTSWQIHARKIFSHSAALLCIVVKGGCPAALRAAITAAASIRAAAFKVHALHGCVVSVKQQSAGTQHPFGAQPVFRWATAYHAACRQCQVAAHHAACWECWQQRA